MVQEVKFFVVYEQDHLYPFEALEKKINKWIVDVKKENKNPHKIMVDAISHCVPTSDNGSKYSVMLLYHYE